MSKKVVNRDIQCRYVKPDNKRCTNRRHGNSDFCWSHHSRLALRRFGIRLTILITLLSLVVGCTVTWALYSAAEETEAERHEEIKGILYEMQAVAVQEEANLLAKYPKGYALLGIDEYKRMTIPYGQPVNTAFSLDWCTMELDYITEEEVSITLPDIYYYGRPVTSNVGFIFARTRTDPLTAVKITTDPPQAIMIEVLSNTENGVVVAIGVKDVLG